MQTISRTLSNYQGEKSVKYFAISAFNLGAQKRREIGGKSKTSCEACFGNDEMHRKIA